MQSCQRSWSRPDFWTRLSATIYSNKVLAQSTTTAWSWHSMTTRIFNSTMILEPINRPGRLSLATPTKCRLTVRFSLTLPLWEGWTWWAPCRLRRVRWRRRWSRPRRRTRARRGSWRSTPRGATSPADRTSWRGQSRSPSWICEEVPEEEIIRYVLKVERTTGWPWWSETRFCWLWLGCSTVYQILLGQLQIGHKWHSSRAR